MQYTKKVLKVNRILILFRVFFGIFNNGRDFLVACQEIRRFGKVYDLVFEGEHIFAFFIDQAYGNAFSSACRAALGDDRVFASIVGIDVAVVAQGVCFGPFGSLDRFPCRLKALFGGTGMGVFGHGLAIE